MGKTEGKQPVPEAGGVVGLIGIRSEGLLYVGKRDTNEGEILRNHHLPEDAGFVALKEAYVLQVHLNPRPDGGLDMRLIPMPIPPFSDATKIVLRAGGLIDLSKEEGLVNIHRGMTGASGLILPGSFRP